MSIEATEVSQDVEQPPADDQTPTEPKEGAKPDEASANSEAAKWRVKLRKAEGERDSLSAQLAAARQGIIDDQAERLGIKPAALRALGKETNSFFNDDGSLKADELTAAVKQAREELGIPAIRPGIVPTSGTGDPNANSAGGWAAALKG